MTTPTSTPGSNIEVDLQATNPRTTFDVSEDYILEAREGAIPDGVVDNFELSVYEDQSKTLSDYYSGDTGSFSRQQATVLAGSYSLQGDSGATVPAFMNGTTSTLNNAPSRGTPFEFLIRNSGNNRFGILYGTPTAGELSGYAVTLGLSGDNTDFNLYRYDSGSLTTLDNVNTEYTTSSTLRVESDWGTDDTHTHELFDGAASLGSVSATDATYTADGAGYVIRTANDGDMYLDNYQDQSV